MEDSEYDIDFGVPLDEDYLDVEKTSDVAREQLTERDPSESEVDFDEIDMTHRMDISDGNGSAAAIDDIIDQEAVIENDGRSDTRTFFYPSQAADGSERQYKRLNRIQDGVGQSSRAADNRAADRRRWIDAYCSALDMVPYQKERVEYVVESVNMSHMAHYSSSKVILAIISLVADEDASRHGPQMRHRTDYKQLLDDADTDLSEIKNVRGLVRDKSDAL